MKERAKRIKRGDVAPFENHRERPVAEHVEDFRSLLESKGNTAAHVTLTVQRLSAVVDGCKFKKLSDLNAGRVSGWLADRRKPKTDKDGNIIAGLSVASSNHYLVAVKSFGHWLVKDRRGPENPFAHLSRLNGRVDVRHERRALTQKELGGLIGAVEKSGETFRGLDGSTRAMLYRVAAMTGLRATDRTTALPGADRGGRRTFEVVVVRLAACHQHRFETAPKPNQPHRRLSLPERPARHSRPPFPPAITAHSDLPRGGLIGGGASAACPRTSSMTSNNFGRFAGRRTSGIHSGRPETSGNASSSMIPSSCLMCAATFCPILGLPPVAKPWGVSP